MLLDLEIQEEGEWFYYFGSCIDQATGEVIYDDLMSEMSKQKGVVHQVFVDDPENCVEYAAPYLVGDEIWYSVRTVFSHEIVCEQITLLRNKIIAFGIIGVLFGLIAAFIDSSPGLQIGVGGRPVFK